MTTYFITRHPGALAWAESIGLNYDQHIEHLIIPQNLNASDIVIGTLPINMVCALNQKEVRYIHLSLDIPPNLRGKELDLEQLKACNATLEEYYVVKKSSELKELYLYNDGQ